MSSSILLGPLTTVFAPQSSCFLPVLNTPYPAVSSKSFRYLRMEGGTQCWPSVVTTSAFFFSPANKYLSPARCPSSYTPNRIEATQTPDLHSYVCCPSGLTYPSSNSPNSGSNIPCTGTITGSLNYFIYDLNNGKTSPFSGANPAITTTFSIEALSLQIQFRDADLNLLDFSPEESAVYGLLSSSSVDAGTLTTAFSSSARTSAAAAASPSSTFSTIAITPPPTPTAPSPPSSGTSSPSQRGLTIGLSAGLGVVCAIAICTMLLFAAKRRQHLSREKRRRKEAEAEHADVKIDRYGYPWIHYPEMADTAVPHELDGVPQSQLP